MLRRFREKPVYLKLTTFFTAQETKNETKLITDSESSSKVKLRTVGHVGQAHVGQFSKFC